MLAGAKEVVMTGDYSRIPAIRLRPAEVTLQTNGIATCIDCASDGGRES